MVDCGDPSRGAVAVPLLDAAVELSAVERWAEARFERALLVLGDLTAPLRHLARLFAYRCPLTGEIRGLAVCFDGFRTPVSSLVADDEQAVVALLACLELSGRVLVVSASQQIGARLGNASSTDPWMVGPCPGPQIPSRSARVEPIQDPREIQNLLLRADMHFWCPEMLRFGHAFGIRGQDGRLVAAACVNFMIERAAYAQIGPVVTDPRARGQSFGSLALAAVRSSLARAGIERCGLFADGGAAELVSYYIRRGFVKSGEFCFFAPRH